MGGFDQQSWGDNDVLDYSNVRPALVYHPETKELLWFNHSHHNHKSWYEDIYDFTDPTEGTPFHTTFANNEPIPRELIETIRSVLWKNSCVVKMRTGDVMLLDNMLCGHGRMSWSAGVSRKLLVVHFEGKHTFGPESSIQRSKH